MKVNKDMFKTGILLGIALIFGFMYGILLSNIKSERYDLNNDGKVDLSDIVILRNYILEHEVENNGEIK